VNPVGPTRILVVGGGGREHALAWTLAGELGVSEVFVAPGSIGISTAAGVTCVAADPLDPEAMVAVARARAVDLVVVGPEAPLASGVADALTAAGFDVFGPSAAAARIEASKAFCHEVAAAAGVPMARAQAFTSAGSAIAFATALAAGDAGCVIKADGLAAGKGVTVCDDAAAATRAIGAQFVEPGAVVLVEERLVGPEVSLIALCDGRAAVALPVARDHKRLADGDRGPNTGGMGAYSPVADLSDEDAATLLATFHLPILAELARRGTPFCGALYAGLMLTADGPILLECNARFGDPETQAILPRLAVALGPLLLAAARGALPDALARSGLAGESGQVMLPTVPGASVAIVLAAAGYPDRPRRGDRIDGIEDARTSGALVFHAGTSRGDDGIWHTAGGRILSVVGHGPDLAAAREAAEVAADAISFDGLQRRHDIGMGAPAAMPAGIPPAIPVGSAT
jgi:phosphoribosylamine--glycine ligase